ncbi:MAG: hypothetical protein ABI868_16955 [Acidobacteriota bacterium]
MRRGAALRLATALATAIVTACGAGGLFQQYEYEEEIYLSLDGSATVYVNSSVPALTALRGLSIMTTPEGGIDPASISALYETPVTHVSRVTGSRRSGRPFVHVRLDVADVRRLGEAPPFAWSTYRFNRDGNLFVYRQTIRPAADKEAGDGSWTGQERVAFRLHLPSRVRYHNTTPDNPKRGNIVVWEQTLEERRHGKPLTLDVRMDPESILYWTLQLFGATFAAVAVTFAVAIWWILRRGRQADRRRVGQ